MNTTPEGVKALEELTQAFFGPIYVKRLVRELGERGFMVSPIPAPVDPYGPHGWPVVQTDMDEAWSVARAALAFRIKCRLESNNTGSMTISHGLAREIVAALEAISSPPGGEGEGK